MLQLGLFPCFVLEWEQESVHSPFWVEPTEGSLLVAMSQDGVASSPPYMGEGADEHFLKLADVVFVVTKGEKTKALLAHSPIIARCCTVSAPLRLGL